MPDQRLAPHQTSIVLRTLVVIDPKVKDYQALVNGAIAGVEVMVLDAHRDGVTQITRALQVPIESVAAPLNARDGVTQITRALQVPIESVAAPLNARDGVTQITRALQGFGNVTNFHIVAHGEPGCLHLGNIQLSAETIGHYRVEIMGWFLTAAAVMANHPPTLLLYGCNVAAGEMGLIFLQRLRNLSGANVAASSTPVGAASKGGNWELDVVLAPSFPQLPLPPLPFDAATLATYPGILEIERVSVGLNGQGNGNAGQGTFLRTDALLRSSAEQIILSQQIQIFLLMCSSPLSLALCLAPLRAKTTSRCSMSRPKRQRRSAARVDGFG